MVYLFVAQSNIQYPMLFKLTNKQAGKSTHCGVLEFVADQGKIYMPYWVSYSITLLVVATVSSSSSSN